MTRQLLPGQRTQVPVPARPRPSAGTPAPQQAAPVRSARWRRPAVLALVAGATVLLAGLGWALVHAPQEAPGESASALLRPRTPTPTSPTVPPSGTATGDAGQAGGAEPGARDPFGGAPAARGNVTTAPGAGPGTTAGTAPEPPTTVTVTAAPARPVAPAPAPATVTSTVTSTVTATRTSTPTATPTVTVTAPGSAVYVGFYAWNRDRASFRVNARTYSYPVGTTFGPQLTFTAVVPGTPRCTRLTYRGGKPFTLCPGQVVKLP